MKILIVTPYLAASYGGPAKSVLEIAQALGGAGIDTSIITTNANDKNTLNVPLHQWIFQEGYQIQYFPCWHKNDLIFSPAMITWLFNQVNNYDLVHTNTIFSPTISMVQWVCQLYQIPYIVTPRGMLESWALAYKATKKRIYYHLIENNCLQKARGIQALVASEASNIQALGINALITVIPNGINSQEFESLPESKMFYNRFPDVKDKTLILFLGRIDPKKGLDLLAAAFTKVHHQFPETHLVVAGPDSIGFLPTVQSYFNQAGCLDAVTFTGMLTGELKLAALSAASLYVAPSYSEGFSMSVLEGMATGLPCIITTGCNFPEAATAQAALVVEIASEAIADALIQCLNNPEAAKAMGDRARKLIFKNYTWKSAAQNLIPVYNAIINSQKLPE